MRMPFQWTRKPALPGLPALDEFRREAVPMKGGSGGETSYTAADHQDRSDLCHIPSDRDATPPPLERNSRIDHRRSWNLTER